MADQCLLDLLSSSSSSSTNDDNNTAANDNDEINLGKGEIAGDCRNRKSEDADYIEDKTTDDSSIRDRRTNRNSQQEEDEEEEEEETSIPPKSITVVKKTNPLFSRFYCFVMRKTWTEYFLSLGLIATILTSIFNAQFGMKARLIQRKAPAPVRFFPPNSPVTDLYDGRGFDLHALLSGSSRTTKTGVIFVMYYAPWCSRSAEARWHLDNLARYFYPASSKDEVEGNNNNSPAAVHFVAVNCWNPTGQCRQSYRLYSYPVFLVYPASTNGIYYNGIISADYMFRFLENAISPLTRLQTFEETLEFLRGRGGGDMITKTRVIAYFDFKSARRPIGYRTFYAGSLKALERDPLRSRTKFALITDQHLADRLNFTRRNGEIKIYRYSINDTTEATKISDYPSDREYSERSIAEWIFDNHVGNPVGWLSPSMASSGKSFAYHQYVTARPTLLVFAPRLPLFDLNPYYRSLTAVALRYWGCFNPSNTSADGNPNSSLSPPPPIDQQSLDETLIRLYSAEEQSRLRIIRWTKYCLRQLRDEARLLGDCCKHVISPLIKYGRFNCYSSTISDKKLLVSDDKSCRRFVPDLSAGFPIDRFFKNVYGGGRSSSSCDRLINEVLLLLSESTSSKSAVIDYCCGGERIGGSAAERFIRKFRRRRQEIRRNGNENAAEPNCEKVRLSRRFGYVYENEDDDHRESTTTRREEMENDRYDWDGLGCRTNRSIQFAALDSRLYGPVASKLMGAAGGNKGSPVALIVDSAKEATYVLDDGPLTVRRIGDFVRDFTFNRLTRFYRSENIENRSWVVGGGSDHVSNNDNINDNEYAVVAENVYIRPVTSSTFRSVVMDRSRDVLLLYTAGWCGGCQRLFHTYQTLAYYFRVVNRDVIFAQIDVTVNDLPWEFTVDTVPSLVFFPANRKSESVAYPSFGPLSLPNLVAFVLSHCSYETRLRFALSTCVKNASASSSVGRSSDSRCLVRNRYRAWRKLSRTERRYRILKVEIERAIRFKEKEISTNWSSINNYDDQDDDDGEEENDIREWRVYLERSWRELAALETKRRTLRYILTNALSRTHFQSLHEEKE